MMKGDNFIRSAKAADIAAAIEAADSYPFDDEHPEWYTYDEIAEWRWRHIDDWGRTRTGKITQRARHRQTTYKAARPMS